MKFETQGNKNKMEAILEKKEINLGIIRDSFTLSTWFLQLSRRKIPATPLSELRCINLIIAAGGA